MRPSVTIDLNADAGESGSGDEALLALVTSVNLACGVHGGGEASIARLSAAALARGVGVGAHPGLPAGRRSVPVSPQEAGEAVASQVRRFLRASRAPLQHVKLHGTLYHAARDPAVARAVVEAVLALGSPILVAQAGSPLLIAGRTAGIEVAGEAFLDRAYDRRGLLVPRDRPGAVLADAGAAAGRAVRIALQRRVAVVDGTEIEVEADTLCVHGDTPGALELLAAARRALEEAGVRIRALGAR